MFTTPGLECIICKYNNTFQLGKGSVDNSFLFIYWKSLRLRTTNLKIRLYFNFSRASIFYAALVILIVFNLDLIENETKINVYIWNCLLNIQNLFLLAFAQNIQNIMILVFYQVCVRLYHVIITINCKTVV